MNVKAKGREKEKRTGSILLRVHGCLHRARQIHFEHPPFQLVQIHVVDRVLCVARRAESDKGESAVFRGCWGGRYPRSNILRSGRGKENGTRKRTVRCRVSVL